MMTYCAQSIFIYQTCQRYFFEAEKPRAIISPQEPLIAEAEMLEEQLKALMEAAGGNEQGSPSSNAMLYG